MIAGDERVSIENYLALAPLHAALIHWLSVIPSRSAARSHACFSATGTRRLSIGPTGGRPIFGFAGFFFMRKVYRANVFRQYRK